MTAPTNQPAREQRAPIDRRQVLRTLGAGTLALAAGCSGSQTTPTATTSPTRTDTPTQTETPMATQSQQDSGIDPQFGFTATSMDTAPPVAPDHTVELLIRPRENVPIPEFFFEPTGLFVSPGDVVRFVFGTPEHTVSAYHPRFGRTQRVPNGVPAVSSPVLGAGTYWLYRFDTEGVYDLFCAPHEFFGMAMRVVAGAVAGPGAEPIARGSEGEGPRPPALTSGLVLRDSALAPETIVSEQRVEWASLDPESKRLLVSIEQG